ncbi:hypothetical protein FACS189490_12000 [Clostridia bacterium]|nr:hypothetical protein FACS189490_12000 [Clostridia bacterium]
MLECIYQGTIWQIDKAPIFNNNHELIEEQAISVKDKHILHISPSYPETESLNYFDAGKITTIDVRPSLHTDIVANVQSMPQIGSNKFNTVIAICMLNNCQDDIAALSEIARVLKFGGEFICYVLPSGAEFTTTESNSTRWYGQEALDEFGVGSWRLYGSVDFLTLLKRFFSYVRVITRTDEPSGIDCNFYICIK